MFVSSFHSKKILNFEPDVFKFSGEEATWNLGCQMLVAHSLGKLLPAVTRDLEDWQPETRKKSTILLYLLLWNVGDKMTMHLLPILNAIIRGSNDLDLSVRKHVGL